MTFQQIHNFITQLDELSDSDFETFYKMVLIRAIKRGLRKDKHQTDQKTKANHET